MTTRVQTVAPFDEDIKRLQKKYPSVRRDIVVLIGSCATTNAPATKSLMWVSTFIRFEFATHQHSVANAADSVSFITYAAKMTFF